MEGGLVSGSYGILSCHSGKWMDLYSENLATVATHPPEVQSADRIFTPTRVPVEGGGTVGQGGRGGLHTLLGQQNTSERISHQ